MSGGFPRELQYTLVDCWFDLQHKYTAYTTASGISAAAKRVASAYYRDYCARENAHLYTPGSTPTARDIVCIDSLCSAILACFSLRYSFILFYLSLRLS